MFQKKSPFELEWEKLQKKEQKFLKGREEKKDSFLNQKTYKIHEYTDQIRQSKKSLKEFGKRAENSGRINILVSGVAGVGMGLAGIGIAGTVGGAYDVIYLKRITDYAHIKYKKRFLIKKKKTRG